jgi:hypothetical protein
MYWICTTAGLWSYKTWMLVCVCAYKRAVKGSRCDTARILDRRHDFWSILTEKLSDGQFLTGRAEPSALCSFHRQKNSSVNSVWQKICQTARWCTFAGCLKTTEVTEPAFADFLSFVTSDILHTNFGRFLHIKRGIFLQVRRTQHQHTIIQTCFPMFHPIRFPITNNLY